MAQSEVMKCVGLYTFANKLSSIPAGSLVEAVNVVIDRDGVIEPRRGYKIYANSFGTSTDTAKQLLTYKGRILRHYGTTIEYDNGGTFLPFSGSYTAPDAGSRIKYIEGNGNLYFTTSTGIKKISAKTPSDFTTAAGYITDAGGIAALDTTARLNYTQLGFMTQDSTVAYRTLWGVKDNNTNLILGSPSARTVISNSVADLLIRDFNNLLSSIDSAAAADLSDKLSLSNNVSTLKISPGSSAAIVRTNLIVLASRLDGNLHTEVVPASALTTTTATVASNIATLTFSGSVTGIFKPGNIINISGMTSNNSVLNGNQTITSVSGSTVLFNITTANYAPTGDTGGTVINLYYSGVAPAAIQPDPTHNDLVGLQAYYDNIINTLLAETTAKISATAQAAGNFINSTQSCVVDLRFSIPAGITTNHFFQVYRSALKSATGVVTLDSLSPDDELQLVYEGNPVAGDLSNGYIKYTDITPESFRGADLYTNANQEGIAQANERPPLATDIGSFKGSTFYANTKTKHRLNLALLGVTRLVSNTSTITITNGTVTNTYTFVTPVNEKFSVTCVGDTANSLNGTYFTINSASDNNKYYIWYKTSGGATSDPAIAGRTGIKVNITTGDSATTVASKTYSAVGALNDFFLGGVIKTNSVAAATVVTSPAHGLTTGDTISVSGSTSTPSIDGARTVTVLTADTFTVPVTTTVAGIGGVFVNTNAKLVFTNTDTGPSTDVAANTSGFTVAVITQGSGEDTSAKKVIISSANTFAQAADESARSLIRCINANASETVYAQYLSGPSDVPGLMLFENRSLADVPFHVTVNDTSTTGQEFNPILPSTGATTTVSDNEVAPNRVYYSKYQQPDSVPILNYFDIGSKDKKILRIIGLRDSLFIFKEDVTYRLSGQDTNSFQVTLHDNSSSLVAPDTAAILNNQIYMFSDQGIAVVSETGVDIISRAIEDALRKLTSPNYTSFAAASFAVGYETDRAYYVWTLKTPTDTHATTCYRYNTFTNSWTQLDLSKTCAIVHPVEKVLYLGASDTNFIEVERKNFNRQDYSDREFAISVINGTVVNSTMFVSTSSNMAIGDVLVQTQYLTINHFNRLLQKLDADLKAVGTPTTYRNYYATLKGIPGDDIRVKVDLLANKLDTDPGVAQSNFTTSIAAYTDTFVDAQSAFNVIVGMLNVDTQVVDVNYPLSVGTISFETPVDSINYTINQITLHYALNFIGGPITLYKAINSQITWAPQILSDAAMLKQARESTVIFDDDSFTNATVSYSTDLSPSFDSIDFSGIGNGVYGYSNNWGDDYWGGQGSGTPFRTYVPLEKQRCRYIQCRIQHNIAFEKYGILGNSYTYELNSSKAYR
jgi:hypothetical protein